MDAASAARRAGLSLSRTRHYRAIGLVPARKESKDWDEGDVARLDFIRRARALGFSIGEIRTLLELLHAPGRSPERMARIAERHAAEIEQRIAVLQTMLAALRRLARGAGSITRYSGPSRRTSRLRGRAAAPAR